MLYLNLEFGVKRFFLEWLLFVANFVVLLSYTRTCKTFTMTYSKLEKLRSVKSVG